MSDCQRVKLTHWSRSLKCRIVQWANLAHWSQTLKMRAILFMRYLCSDHRSPAFREVIAPVVILFPIIHAVPLQ